MSLSRRRMLVAACAGVAACSRRPAPPRRTGPLQPKVLDDGTLALMRQARPAIFNLGVASLADGDRWFADPTGHYPMTGVARLIVATAALAAVDAGRLKLGARVEVTAEDLSGPPGPIDALFPGAGPSRAMVLPIADLVALAVQARDATASDVLLAQLGGPAAVTQWLVSVGVEGVRVDRYERQRIAQLLGLPEFRPDWRSQAALDAARHAISPAVRQSAAEAFIADGRDTATAPGLLDFLTRLSSGALLKPASSAFLLRLMAAQAAGPGGVAAGLPPGSKAQSVDGVTPTDLGYTAAQAAAGLVQLPDGRRLAYAVFLTGSTATAAARARLMSDTGRLLARSVGD